MVWAPSSPPFTWWDPSWVKYVLTSWSHYIEELTYMDIPLGTSSPQIHNKLRPNCCPAWLLCLTKTLPNLLSVLLLTTDTVDFWNVILVWVFDLWKSNVVIIAICLMADPYQHPPPHTSIYPCQCHQASTHDGLNAKVDLLETWWNDRFDGNLVICQIVWWLTYEKVWYKSGITTQ